MLSKKTILFFIFLFLSVTTYFISDKFKSELVNNFKNQLIENSKNNLSIKYDLIYENFINDTYNRSQSIVKNYNIADFLIKPYKEFSFFNSDDINLKIYDNKGLILYSNTSIEEKEKLPLYQINQVLNQPLHTVSFITSIKGLTLSHFIPVFENNFLGVAQIDFHFDHIAKMLEQENIKAVILLNKDLSQTVNLNLSYSRNFLKENYIVNKNADNYYIKILEQNEIDDDIILVKKDLPSASNGIAQVYLLKTVDDLDLSYANTLKNIIDISTVLLLLFYLFSVYLIFKSYQNRYFLHQNRELLEENKKLTELSDKLDFNEKKLSNLFNLQPNIMFISNGVDIIQVNKRFMGFFRRYKSFENFKKNHKDISELFEKSDNPNYISTPLIDDKYWLEYILENPKRLYKAIMSVDNEQHHFIIKVNEMDYVKNFQERYIVVAFVDVTQDVNEKTVIPNYDIPLNDIQDVTFLIETGITSAVKEFTAILPSRQTIFKASNHELNDITFLKIAVNFTSKNKKDRNWEIMLSSKFISFVINQITSDYDNKLEDEIDVQSIKAMLNFTDHILFEFTQAVNDLKHKEFYPLGYKQTSYNIIDNNVEFDDRNLYKFIMFIEDQELDIYFNFDQSSMEYLKQLQMLGLIFNN